MPEIKVTPLGRARRGPGAPSAFPRVGGRSEAAVIDAPASCPCAGAGQDVGRSCILVSIAGKNVMLDCGMHMGYNDDVSQAAAFLPASSLALPSPPPEAVPVRGGGSARGRPVKDSRRAGRCRLFNDVGSQLC